MKMREEKDSIGVMQVPEEAYYGVQTLRASENFRITKQKVHPEFIKSMVEIKIAAAATNRDAGVLEESIAEAIIKAGNEVLGGKWLENFIVDSIQGGAGTSLNMNVNEVLANRAIELLGGKKGEYHIVHPNDHVNCGQSTNDVFPSAGKITLVRLLLAAVQELTRLEKAFSDKGREFKSVIKMGRTEMQDAVPISLGQSFSAYARAVGRDIKRFYQAVETLSKLNMGGTAIGTGITANQTYIENIVNNISDITGLSFRQATDLVDATQNLDDFVVVSGIVKACASNLFKISNDLRLMSSGPRTGFCEINLPPRQNGSSIMPGKVNPVMPEVINQIAFKIMGNDTTITMAAESGELELNAFEPVIFHCFFESLDILRRGVSLFTDYCITGITANERECRRQVEKSAGLATALCPYIGYSRAAEVAKQALREDKTIPDVIKEEAIMSQGEWDEVFGEVLSQLSE